MNDVAPAFELPNPGAGPDPCSLSDLTAGHDFVVMYFSIEYSSADCRSQITRLAKRYSAFHVRDATAAAVVPEPAEDVARWAEWLDPPFPLMADPDGATSADYGQPVRLGFISDWSEYLGRMPTFVVVDARGPDPEVAWRYRGKSTFDRPKTATVLDAIDGRRGEQ